MAAAESPREVYGVGMNSTRLLMMMGDLTMDLPEEAF
jgi:hypothetical protein